MLFSRKKLPNELDISLLSNARDGRRFTPDLWKLEQHEYLLTFFADEFMDRHPMHNVLSPYLRPLSTHQDGIAAYTADNYWAFWRRNLGPDSYPIPLVNHIKRNITGRIRGQIMAIRPYMFIDLDNYYQNKYKFIRIRSNILIPYRSKVYNTRIGDLVSDEFVQMVRAYMYVGIPSYWDHQLDGGMLFKPVQSFEPKKKEGKWFPGRYFYYSLGEYNNEASIIEGS